MARKLKRLSITMLVFLVAALLLPALPVAAETPNISVKFERIEESPVDVTFRVTLTNASPLPEKGLAMTTLLEELSLPITSLNQITVEKVVKQSYIYQVPVYGWVTVNATANTTATQVWEIIGYTPETRYREVKSNFKNWSYQGQNPGTTASITLPGYNADRDGWGGGILVLDFTINTGTVKRTDTGGWGSKGVLALDIDGIKYFDVINSSWWGSSWIYRNTLSFNATAISENLTSFPVKVTLSANNFDFTKASSNGSDVRFVDADNVTSLPYEFEWWDSVNQTAVAWVQVPQINASSNYTDHVYIYYGNAAATDNQNPNAVWSGTGAVAVWHLGADSNNGTLIYDSTANGNTGNTTTTTWSRDGRTFNDSSGLINVLDAVNLRVANITILMWIKPNGHQGNDDRLVDKGFDTAYCLTCRANDTMAFYAEIGLVDQVFTSTLTYTINALNLVGVSYNGTTGFFYINGATKAFTPSPAGNISASVANLIIGATATTSYLFKGIIGEVQIYNDARTVEESKADYMNQVDNLLDYGTRVELAIPTVVTNPAYGIGETTATLSGNITAMSGEDADYVGFEWDTDNGTPYTSNTTIPGTYGIGEFHETRSLALDTLYYYRAYAHNSAGWSWGDEESFTTLPILPLAPTNFIIAQTGTNSVTLNWTLGTYATTTIIRGKEDGQPTSITDGYEVYNDTGTTTNVTGLNLGTSTYYYSAWSNNPTGYSVDCAKTNIGGASMMLIGFMILALALTLPAFLARKAVLAFAGAGAWIILAVYAYTKSATPAGGDWDIYYALFFLSCGLVLVCSLEPAIMRTPKAEVGEDLFLDDVDTVEKEYDDISQGTRIPRVGRRARAIRAVRSKRRKGTGPQY